ncbi:hypothetical protein ENSA5_23680 [Enhygromyxa salina]|uniref:Uncharacterized protein n=2 Tax=Enhygromyxa salina TaxID=215803 RepID=A0A2S9YBG1_9BACT|nr:hypothetical protein ENSA5_23680 [Enhygromyxa salina]
MPCEPPCEDGFFYLAHSSGCVKLADTLYVSDVEMGAPYYTTIKSAVSEVPEGEGSPTLILVTNSYIEGSATIGSGKKVIIAGGNVRARAELSSSDAGATLRVRQGAEVHLVRVTVTNRGNDGDGGGDAVNIKDYASRLYVDKSLLRSREEGYGIEAHDASEVKVWSSFLWGAKGGVRASETAAIETRYSTVAGGGDGVAWSCGSWSPEIDLIRSIAYSTTPSTGWGWCQPQLSPGLWVTEGLDMGFPEWFANYGMQDLHAVGAPPPEDHLVDRADGDPLCDIDGDPIPEFGGYPGADQVL